MFSVITHLLFLTACRKNGEGQAFDAGFQRHSHQRPLYRVDVDAMREAFGDAATVSEFSLPDGSTQRRISIASSGRYETPTVCWCVSGRFPEIIERLPRLKVVALHGVGVDQVDVAAATEHGIFVTNVPGGNTPGVVELTVGLMISMLRRIPAADRGLRAEHDWDGSRFLGSEIGSRTVGLIGFGNIARGVAVHLPNVPGAGHRARRTGQRAHREMASKSLASTRSSSGPTSLSVHVPLNDETRGMIDKIVFSRMKPGSYLVNVSRGLIVVQDDLVAALQKRAPGRCGTRRAGVGAARLRQPALHDGQRRRHPAYGRFILRVPRHDRPSRQPGHSQRAPGRNPAACGQRPIRAIAVIVPSNRPLPAVERPNAS
ncbi:MAG: NAD(P)-dependent oxidoreductase [Thermomicrobiales bacterium]